MDIDTSYHIIDSVTKGHGRLVVTVTIDGDEAEEHEFVYLSGPIDDIRDFVNGKADMAEIRRRWKMVVT